MTSDQLLTTLGLLVVASPGVLLALLGLSQLFGRPLTEAGIARATQAAVWIGLAPALAILGLMLSLGTRHVEIELGNWVAIPREHFHFHIKFVFDRLSVPFVILTFVLCGTVGAFGSRYLHREAGYRRFFILYAIFLLGMIVSALAGTVETLFVGWELVGLSSALLVAYFHERPAPVRNGLRVWSVYRVADAAFLIAAIALHHLTGEGEFSDLMGRGAWPDGAATLTSRQALYVGSLLLVAAAGKSGLIPFSGWLPRAMEGPTPSSAIFYGALSVHLGTYLLLRVGAILVLSPWLSAAVIILGLASAVLATLAGRVQTDIKSALAFASLAQVGIITAEIGLGWRYIPLIHMIGHACLRTLQLLRAPTLLRDYHTLENAIGARLPHQTSRWTRWIPDGILRRGYRLAFERGYLDAGLDAWVVLPLLALFHQCDHWERAWTDWLSGRRSRESDQIPPTPAPWYDSPSRDDRPGAGTTRAPATPQTSHTAASSLRSGAASR